jgi:superfamily I DNA/RNA helicase
MSYLGSGSLVLEIIMNEEQQLVVRHPVGSPVCLIAGAGSGKTLVLTERVRWLIAEAGQEPRKLAALTFTNKAANEMADRLGVTVDTPRDRVPRVSTIHSLALAAIRRNPRGFGLQERVSLLDDYDQGILLKKIIDREIKESDRDQFNPWNLLERIAYHRARGVGFSTDYTAEIHQQSLHSHSGYHALDSEVVYLWKKFEDEKQATSTLDFSDMLHLVVRRVQADKSWATAWAKMFNYVLVDEVQDLSPVQWQFVESLIPVDNFNLFVVGDLSQSIYGFNGAAPEILKAYSEKWRGVTPTLYRLAQNYRSVPEIVGLANAVQKKMVMTIPLQMASARGDLGHTGNTSSMKGGEDDGTPREIANRIASQIYRDRQTTPYKENAILVRSGKSQVRDIESELVRLRIPYVVRGGQGLLQTEEVRDVLAYLRLAVNPKDFMALNRAIAAPKRGLGTVALEKIRDVANKQFAGDLLSGCWAVNKDKAGAFVDIVKHIQQKHDDPVNAFDFAIKLSGYSNYLRDKYRKDIEKLTIKLENLERLALLVVGLLETNIMNLADVVFQLSMDEQAKDEDKDGRVVISTIHKAKGLEWRSVWLTNCYQGSLPHMYSMGSPEEIDEERRLFYTALTRAKDQLTICVPTFLLKKTSTGWSKVRVEPSEFLTEIGIL